MTPTSILRSIDEKKGRNGTGMKGVVLIQGEEKTPSRNSSPENFPQLRVKERTAGRNLRPNRFLLLLPQGANCLVQEEILTELHPLVYFARGRWDKWSRVQTVITEFEPGPPAHSLPAGDNSDHLTDAVKDNRRSTFQQCLAHRMSYIQYLLIIIFIAMAKEASPQQTIFTYARNTGNFMHNDK